MQNNNPKSENHAMKERAAEAKNERGRQQSIAREQKPREQAGPAPVGSGEAREGAPKRK